MFNVNKIREDFPFLKQNINGKKVIFLDTGASAQKPKVVINAITNSYMFDYANVHRGVYSLSQEASEKYENVRNIVKNFINAPCENEIVITKGTTESINLIADCLSNDILTKDSEIVTTIMEHHANFVPWQSLAKKNNFKFNVADITENGELDLKNLYSLINKNTKILAITHCSNVLGTINPIKEIISKVKEINPNIIIVVDGAQSILHSKIDVQDLGCDFFVFSSHKIYGATGTGILYGKYDLLDKMTPYKYGGDMIDTVTIEKTTYAKPPLKFEAGTPDIVGTIGLGEAIKYVDSIGIDNIAKYEKKLLQYATEKLQDIEGLKILGQADNKAGVITFIVDGCHASDIGELLAIRGICVRTGQHCAHPLLQRYNVTSTVRASFGMYNTIEEIDLFVNALNKIITRLK